MLTEHLEIVHQLATRHINPSEFDSPSKYLNWFLRTLSPCFSEQDKLQFTHVQFFDFNVSDNKHFMDGRLIGFPTVYGVTNLESLIEIHSEIITFLTAVSIMHKINFEGVRTAINAFQDKMIIETFTKSNDGPLVEYEHNRKVVSLNLPNLYDPDISRVFYDLVSSKVRESNCNAEDGFIITTDTMVNEIIGEIFASGKYQALIPLLEQFLNSEKVKKISNQIYEELSKLNQNFGFSQDDTAMKIFIATGLLHSWIKSFKHNYMFTSARYNNEREPSSYAILLAVTQQRLNKETLNLLHIALNTAFSALTEIQKWFTNNGRPEKEQKQYKKTFCEKTTSSDFVYKSTKMRNIDFEISKLARTNEHVLLLGETGVGKDLIASEIHRRSNRSDKPFKVLPINSLSESLIESELFGYSKGSFTGAVEDRMGKIEDTNGGTIYIPEISELSERVQLKLLEFIQFSHIERIGHKGKKQKIDVRLIFASNANPELKIKEGKLREDFYYRISVVDLYIPPLRERQEDIPVLAEYLIKKHSKRIRGEEVKADPSIYNLLIGQSWKGNVRQLEHLVISALVKSDNNFLHREHFEKIFNDPNSQKSAHHDLSFNADFKTSESEFKRKYFINLLKQTNGKVSEAARIAGISRQALYHICKEHNIKI